MTIAAMVLGALGVAGGALLLSGADSRGVGGPEVTKPKGRETEGMKAQQVAGLFAETRTVGQPSQQSEDAEDAYHSDEGPEWEGQPFPPFTQVPGELGEVTILAGAEVILDSGRTLRLLHITSEATGEHPVLLIEGGDGYGGVAKRGIFDPTSVRILHGEEDNGIVFHRLEAIGLADLAMSSTYDERISVQTPGNPLLILEFISAVQGQLGETGEAQLVPLRDGWGDLTPSHGDQVVRLGRGQ